MLPAANRLRTAADFRETTRRGSRATRGCAVVYVCLSPAVGPPRIGLIVGKAVGGSVHRHRAARRIRAAVAGQVADLPVGALVVIRALPGADTDPGLALDVTEAVLAATHKSRRAMGAS
ncbi:MAG: ribonuclease P protein component [Actinomycetes bacterium]